jgi:hypothetical protein
MSKSNHHFFTTKFMVAVITFAASSAGLYGGIFSGGDAKGINIYAAGDIADCRMHAPAETNAARTAELVAEGLSRDKDSVALALGDTTYPNGLLSEFEDCYEPTWGRFKNRTLPAPGNHEYYTPEAVGYYTYFGNIAGPDRRGYYSVDLGKWHIVSLNSNLTPALHQRQLDWLKIDLAEHPAKCTLAFWHHPYYSSGGHGNNDLAASMWKVLLAADVDVVLSGHDHDYERFSPQDAKAQRDDKHGIRAFVVGTGGARLTPFLFEQPNSEVRDNSTAGILRLNLKDSSYEWEFIPVPGGHLNDSGSGLCH